MMDDDRPMTFLGLPVTWNGRPVTVREFEILHGTDEGSPQGILTSPGNLSRGSNAPPKLRTRRPPLGP